MWLDMEVRCNECEKHLFEIEDGTNLGSVGAVCQRKGFIYKNAVLFSDKYSSLFFCTKECSKSFYDKHIPKNIEVTEKLNELKSDIPRMTKECCEGLAKIQAMFNKKHKK